MQLWGRRVQAGAGGWDLGSGPATAFGQRGAADCWDTTPVAADSGTMDTHSAVVDLGIPIQERGLRLPLEDREG